MFADYLVCEIEQEVTQIGTSSPDLHPFKSKPRTHTSCSLLHTRCSTLLRFHHLAFTGVDAGHGIAGVDDQVGPGGELVEIEGGVIRRDHDAVLGA